MDPTGYLLIMVGVFFMGLVVGSAIDRHVQGCEENDEFYAHRDEVIRFHKELMDYHKAEFERTRNQ